MSNMYVTSPQPPDSFRFLDVTFDSRLLEPTHRKDTEKTTILNCRLKHLFFTHATFKYLDSTILNKFVFYNIKQLGFDEVTIESMDERVKINSFKFK